MHVLHIMKSAAHLAIAMVYWAMLQGFHEPWLYALLCYAYVLILTVEVSE
jgi:hypothetical protein